MIEQRRAPERSVFTAGDLVRLTLDPHGEAGQGFVRTNLGFAGVSRREIIAAAEEGEPAAGLAWHDVPMERAADGTFELVLPLLEPGVFEAKCCLRAPDGSFRWPGGDNFLFKVESAENAAANTIYCAFVRQFGGAAEWRPEQQRRMELAAAALDDAGCTVIPPSGTFRQVIAKLDHIFDRLGCRILQLLPIHPVPTVYGRMGRFGSPFAATDYFAVDPALADFDPAATPLAQFLELVDAVHARQGRLFLDIPVNHTGWGSRTQAEHPEYFVRDEAGRFVSPGAWGVTWADLCQLDYRRPEVPRMMAEVFLYWCRHGVDGFRCDAGYMLPAAAWSYITAKVREEYPDTVFLLEGLGGRIEVQEDLLLRRGLDWGYSELFQNETIDQIASCRAYAAKSERACGTLVHFAETHDNLRLAAKSPHWAAMRCVLCALLTENGGFGFANGVELLATERIDVHGAAPLDWRHEPNLIALLHRLNALLAGHPAFFRGAETEWIGSDGACVVLLRRPEDAPAVLVLVNPDCGSARTARWEAARFHGRFDLLTGNEIDHGPGAMTLEPGGFACLSEEPFDLPEPAGEPARVHRQRLTRMAWRLRCWFGAEAAPEIDELARDPWGFCRALSRQPIPPVTRCRLGRDEHRLVPVPAGDLLLLEGASPFRAELVIGEKTVRFERSLAGGKHHFALFLPPRRPPKEATVFELRITEFPAGGAVSRRTARILELPAAEDARWQLAFSREEAAVHCAFAANDRGGMAFVNAAWGELRTKYEALLAANGPAGFPVDRRVLFTRCRGWVAADGYSCAIDAKSLVRFTGGPDNRAEWVFALALGQGRTLALTVTMEFALDGDAVRLRFARGDRDDRATGVKIILRPDIEDRVNHELTKAYTGPEKTFPAAVRPLADGFRFAPAEDRELVVTLPGGRFVPQPEWQYMVNLPVEERYGQEHATDLFSPGYLEYRLDTGAACELTAAFMCDPAALRWPEPKPLQETAAPLAAAEAGLRPFIVRRDDWRSVIAGYPWFLDWGRDTLIAARGLIAVGRRADAEAILRVFATFEENGTIPNVIRGREVANRDTSDAPLWLFVAAGDFIRRFRAPELLEMRCGERSFLDILQSIVAWYRRGTPNGIRVDAASGLVWSPAHFTWMDTNYPAGTPREGYPIEIQALWIAALEMLERHTGDAACRALREQAQASLLRSFFLTGRDRFSDCLHTEGFRPAAEAMADDHIRSNQLLAVTLGAVTAPEHAAAVVRSAEQLLVPGAIRSLADRPVEYELPIVREGVLLNDPRHPYRGRYEGPEDTSRKVAYHNGTAWLWPYPSFCEALYLLGGEAARPRAASLLHAACRMADQLVPGFLSEIADGDAPHRGQGCPAQAWSMTEFCRVARLLEPNHDLQREDEENG